MTVPRERPGQRARATDEEVLDEIDRLAVEHGRTPGRDMVMQAAGVGAPRASRLLKVWEGQGRTTGRPAMNGRDSRVVALVSTDQAVEPRPVGGGVSASSPTGRAAAQVDRSGPIAPPESEAEETVEFPAVDQSGKQSAQVIDRSGPARPEQRETVEGADRLDRSGPVEPDRSAESSQSDTRPVDLPARPTVEPTAVEEEPDRTSTDPTDRGQTADPTADSTVAPTVAPTDEPTDEPTGEEADRSDRRWRWSTALFILGALVGLAVSVDTSWRFFGEKLGITNTVERAAMFSGIELLLIACGVAMFEGVRGPRRSPGPARWLAWALCAASGYAAFVLSGPAIGVARILLGPVLSVVAFHFALGIEIRARRGGPTGTLARVAAELRERVLSRLGLGDDGRDALARTRDRAARRAAHLANTERGLFRRSRLRRAIRQANVAHDGEQRRRMLAELAALRHVEELETLVTDSPWRSAVE